MRSSSKTFLRLALCSLLVFMSRANSLAQQPQKNVSPQPASTGLGKKPTPPYDFRLIAQSGETISGIRILDFSPEGLGFNVAMNEKGQTAYLTQVATLSGSPLVRS